MRRIEKGDTRVKLYYRGERYWSYDTKCFVSIYPKLLNEQLNIDSAETLDALALAELI